MTSEDGFTLIEALVALLILAIASAGIIGAIETQVDTTRGLEQRTAALWVAENRLAELRLAGGAPPSGTGSVEMLGATWPVRVTARSSDDPDLRLVEIEVGSSSKAAAKEPLMTLRGFVDAGTTTRP